MTKRPSSPSSGWVRARLYHLFAPLIALLVVALVEQTWLGELLEDQTVNLRFRARAAFDSPADPRLVFLGIDQRSLDLLGRYPWPRTTVAALLTDIAQANANPHGVTFDILYTEPSENPADDAALADAVGLLPNVVTAALSVRPEDVSKKDAHVIEVEVQKTKAEIEKPGYTKPFTHVLGDVQKVRGSNIATLPVDAVREQSFFGFANDEPSTVDDIRHTIPLIIRLNDQIYPSLALQTLCLMLGADADKVEVNVGRNVVLKDLSGKTYTIPMNERGEYTINYRHSSAFRSLGLGLFAAFMEKHLKDGSPMPSECDIQQKTVVIGEAATGMTDLGPTPIQAASPLVYTHLNVINNVLKGDYLIFVPWFWVVIGWACVTWPTLLRLKEAPLAEAVAVPIGIMILYTAVAFAIFGFWSIQIALGWPVVSYALLNFGGVVLRWREEQKGRQQIKQLMSSMVSPEIMNHLLKHPENMQLGGANRPATVLFSDIRGYTKFSEGLEVAEVVRQLNAYFDRMVDCVFDCKGTFHKFIGDAIMAAWGDIEDASLGVQQDAKNAVKAALMMRGKLRQLNEERQAENLSPIKIGIGLNHGIVQAGMLGSTGQREFTVMGDAVNTASRLEGMTKEFKTDLVISDSVRDLVGDDFVCRRVGSIVLMGKTTPTVVYEVVGEKNDMTHARMSISGVGRYEEAFDHFLARRFDQAEPAFADCEKEYPDDYCIKTYLKATRDFIATPPPADWDGRIVMTTK